jgi:hypothetical protein
MNQTSLKSLFKQGVFSSISVLRKNTNGFLYVTLVGTKGSNNVYFGQKSSDILNAKYQVGDNIAKELGGASVVLTTNAEGEMRHKISLQGVANDYASVGDMETLFGCEQDGTLDIVAFVKEFTVAPAENTGGGNRSGGTGADDIKKKLETAGK